MSRARNLIAFFVGVLFALGLGISGMVDPEKSFGFFDVGGLLGLTDAVWDPTLLFVMAGALLVYLVMLRLSLRRVVPVLDRALQLPTRRDIDRRLVVGALLFGAGWGLSGFCPGPGLTSVITGNSAVQMFVIAMTAGMFLHEGFDRVVAVVSSANRSAAGRSSRTRSVVSRSSGRAEGRSLSLVSSSVRHIESPSN